MPAPTVVSDFLDCVRKSGVADAQRLEEFLARAGDVDAGTPAAMADALVNDGLLTRFQADQLLRGRWRNFILAGKYIILEPLGAGGMGAVYLCLHKIMRRPVAVKVLPAAQADDPGAVERFHREAQAVAQLRHPNIVGAHDVDRDGKFHFLVMEFVDGVSLQDLVRRRGPLDPIRAAHYVHQAALGLEHAHEAGLVHRDVKPANLLVDRQGVVKILDLGLARFFRDTRESVTQKYDGNAVLGTADYLAPEQAVDSHNVDIRCDIYSLGMTFYFLLAGRGPFQDGSVAEKLIWQQVRTPKPIRELRPDVPEGLAAVLEKMIAKDPAQRYQTPAAAAAALAPWTQTPIDPPSADEIPPPSSGARIAGAPEGGGGAARTAAAPTPRPAHATPASSRSRLPSRPGAGDTDARDNGRTAVSPAVPATVKTSAGARLTAGDVETVRSNDVGAKRPRAVPWLLVAGGVAAMLALAGVGVGIALLTTRPPGSNPNPAPRNPIAGVRVTQDDDGLHVKTASYEALVDADGFLNSLRAGGVEFLKPGEPLAGGKTKAKGAYFYYEKAGHQGAVKLPNIERPADNVAVAGGDKFSIRYEFNPDEIVVKPSNNTDDDVPFYIILDTATVTDVVNGSSQRLAVPVARQQSDPLDPAWQTTTWIAGRARLKITDGTRIWGPWGQAHAQVWDRSIPTYQSAEIRLTPGVGPDVPRAVPPGGVLLTRNYSTHRVQSELYEAVVEDDGCLSSLRVDGVEFLHPGLNVSRGSYFLGQGGIQRMTDVRQPAPNVLTADGPKTSVRYEFGPDKMTWQLDNHSNEGRPFFIVFDPGVLAGRIGDDWVKAPGAVKVMGDLTKTPMAWYAGRARIALTGGNKVWGPWPDASNGHQVWEVSLQPNEKRTVTVEIARAPTAEVDKAAATAGVQAAPASEMALYGPLEYQVFQRNTRTQGEITVRGRVRVDCDRVEWRLTGKPLEGAARGDWEALPPDAGTRAFQATLPAPAGGWYRLEVRALNGGKEVASAAVGHVGVGEVLVGAGQSNSTNCGQEKIQQHSGMASSFSGTYWQLADDPQPGNHDDSTGGSFWPAFGDAMYEKYHVPIGIASTGHSGTSVNQWLPDAPEPPDSPTKGLFQWTTERMNELGPHGFRAVLWHQGESDTGMTADDYARKMTTLIEQSRGAAGWNVPWFVAQVSYHNPKATSFASVRDGQKKLWDSGAALEGPDTDTLTGDNRDQGGEGIHFSPKGLTAHGKMWAAKVGVWLDKELAK
jgi:serine/threonine protein kinase